MARKLKYVHIDTEMIVEVDAGSEGMEEFEARDTAIENLSDHFATLNGQDVWVSDVKSLNNVPKAWLDAIPFGSESSTPICDRFFLEVLKENLKKSEELADVGQMRLPLGV